MWIHLNLILIGMLTIFVPAMYTNTQDVQKSLIIMSTILFFAGIYLTALYFVMLFYKDSRDKALKECESLKKELELIKGKVN